MDQRLSALTSLLVGYLQYQGTSMSGGRLLIVCSFRLYGYSDKKQRTPKCCKLVILLLSGPRHCTRNRTRFAGSISRTSLGPYNKYT